MKFKMKLNFDWSSILLPVWQDFKSINNDQSGSFDITQNNWDLINNGDYFKNVVDEIKQQQEKHFQNNTFKIIKIKNI